MHSRRYHWVIVLLLTLLLSSIVTSCNDLNYYTGEDFESTLIRVVSHTEYSKSDSSFITVISCKYGMGQTLNEYGVSWTYGKDRLPVYERTQEASVSLDIRPSNVGVDVNEDKVRDNIGVTYDGNRDAVYRDTIFVQAAKDTIISVRAYLILNWTNIVYGDLEVLNE